MQRCIKLYGERNSGTNYLSNLLALNLDIQQLRGVVPDCFGALQRLLPGREWLCDLYFSLTFPSNLGWKHARAEPLASQPGCNVCFITITKNPYAWLLSMYRRPHHQYYRNKPDFETFLQSPWETVGRDNCGKALASPIALWNIKNRSYHQLREMNGLNLTVEGLLLAPEQTIDGISDHFAFPRKCGVFINYHTSTTESGKNFDDYRRYYLGEQWREELTEQNISIINRTLDRSLMEAFGYQWL